MRARARSSERRNDGGTKRDEAALAAAAVAAAAAKCRSGRGAAFHRCVVVTGALANTQHTSAHARRLECMIQRAKDAALAASRPPLFLRANFARAS